MKWFAILIIVLFLSAESKSQQIFQGNNFLETKSSASFLPVTLTIASILYLINPEFLYTDRKLYAGFTKEFSIGWGKIGEHRTAVEYSFIFTGNISHHLRFSYQYDILLKSGIKPSHMFQSTSVLSIGAGYFTDFKGKGVFPELSYGYSIRNHKLLFFPYVRLRHTFMFEEEKSNISDFSFGIIFGIANPFIDVKINK